MLSKVYLVPFFESLVWLDLRLNPGLPDKWRTLNSLYFYSTDMLVELFSLFWNILFWLYCLTLSRYLLSLPSFVNIFWFISSGCITWLICRLILMFSFQYTLACFPFPRCHSFFTCPSSLISHPGFVFVFGFFRFVVVFGFYGISTLAGYSTPNPP